MKRYLVIETTNTETVRSIYEDNYNLTFDEVFEMLQSNTFTGTRNRISLTVTEL